VAHRVVARNTISNVLKFAVSVVITFVMTPVYIGALGDHDYGVWEIVASLIGYLGMLDIGLRPTISRFMSRVSPITEGHQWRALYSTSVFLLMIVGLVGAALFLAWAFVAPEVIAPDIAQRSRYQLFLFLMALNVLVSFPLFSLDSALEGSQRYVIRNYVAMGHSLVFAVVVYQTIDQFDPLILLCVGNLIMAASKSIWFLWLLAPPGPGPKLPAPSYFEWATAKKMYRFGFKAFVQGTSTMVEARADTLIIGAFLGPALVVFYSIPLAIVSRIQGLLWTLTHATMPAFSSIDARGDRSEAESLFLTGSRGVVALMTLMVLGAVCLGKPFIELWVGGRYAAQGQAILVILAASMFLSNIVPLGSRYLTAMDRHGVLAKLGVRRALINICASLLLVHWYGPTGVALGTLIATTAVVHSEWSAVLNELGMSLTTYLTEVLRPVVVPGMVAFSFGFLGRSLALVDNWIGFLAVTFVMCSAYLLLHFFSLSQRDRQYVTMAVLGRRKR